MCVFMWIVAIECFGSLAIWLKCTLHPLSLGSLLIGPVAFKTCRLRMLNYFNDDNVPILLCSITFSFNVFRLFFYVQDGVIYVWFDGKILMDVGKRYVDIVVILVALKIHVFIVTGQDQFIRSVNSILA